MAETNLFRMDDLLIRSAIRLGLVVVLGTLLFAAVLFGGPPETRPALGAGWALVGLVLLAPVALLAGGLSLRRRERRAVALMRLLDRQLVVDAADLVHNSDFSREQLARAIHDVNGSGQALLVWDPKTDQVQDGRLRRSFLQVDECGACGAKISQQVPLAGHSVAVDCPHCGTPLSARDIEDARERLVDEIHEQNRLDDPPPGCETPDFSVTIFVLLMLFCWPLALVYGMRCWKVVV